MAKAQKGGGRVEKATQRPKKGDNYSRPTCSRDSKQTIQTDRRISRERNGRHHGRIARQQRAQISEVSTTGADHESNLRNGGGNGSASPSVRGAETAPTQKATGKRAAHDRSAQQQNADNSRLPDRSTRRRRTVEKKPSMYISNDESDIKESVANIRMRGRQERPSCPQTRSKARSETKRRSSKKARSRSRSAKTVGSSADKRKLRCVKAAKVVGAGRVKQLQVARAWCFVARTHCTFENATTQIAFVESGIECTAYLGVGDWGMPNWGEGVPPANSPGREP